MGRLNEASSFVRKFIARSEGEAPLVAIGAPKGRSEAAKYLCGFSEEAKAKGLVAAAIAQARVIVRRPVGGAFRPLGQIIVVHGDLLRSD